MDGTGELFQDFVMSLPAEFETDVVPYPRDLCFSDSELVELVRLAAPLSDAFVLLAESFSTPIAIQYAATRPPNLRALVLCAGFVTSPLSGWKRAVGWFLAPILFSVPLPNFAIRRFLVGANASSSLLRAVRSAVSSVKPSVLSSRLRSILSCDARNELARVAVPILYLRAKGDRLVRDVCTKEILRLKPETLLEVRDGPHLILQRESRLAANTIAKFVGQFR
jgi:pimeloyl-ACP methyl ester carboxylesterase